MLCSDIESIIMNYKQCLETHEKYLNVVKELKTIKIVYKVPYRYHGRLMVKQLFKKKKLHPTLSYNMCNYCDNHWKWCDCIPIENRLYIDLCYFFLSVNKRYKNYHYRTFVVRNL